MPVLENSRVPSLGSIFLHSLLVSQNIILSGSNCINYLFICFIYLYSYNISSG